MLCAKHKIEMKNDFDRSGYLYCPQCLIEDGGKPKGRKVESLKVRVEKMVLEYQHKIDDQDKLIKIQEEETMNEKEHGLHDSICHSRRLEEKLRAVRQVYVQAQKDIESFLDYAE